MTEGQKEILIKRLQALSKEAVIQAYIEHLEDDELNQYSD